MLRRSSKRKETDVDFEEKKMTLGIQGQEEYDKENEFYPRPSSPIYDDYHDRYRDLFRDKIYFVESYNRNRVISSYRTLSAYDDTYYVKFIRN